MPQKFISPLPVISIAIQFCCTLFWLNDRFTHFAFSAREITRVDINRYFSFLYREIRGLARTFTQRVVFLKRCPRSVQHFSPLRGNRQVSARNCPIQPVYSEKRERANYARLPIDRPWTIGGVTAYLVECVTTHPGCRRFARIHRYAANEMTLRRSYR